MSVHVMPVQLGVDPHLLATEEHAQPVKSPLDTRVGIFVDAIMSQSTEFSVSSYVAAANFKARKTRSRNVVVIVCLKIIK